MNFNSMIGSGLISIVGLMGLAHAEEATQAALIEKGRALSATCAACHGVDGNSIAPNFPNLAGQNAAYLLKQMRQFKTDEKTGKALREDPVMGPQMAAVANENMAALAHFFAAQKPNPKPATKPELRAKAEKLYRGGDATRGLAACASCHGPAGGGIPSQYPSIGGQNADYLKTQLINFRSGARHNDPEEMMRLSSRYLTDGEIDALADYISGLRLSK